MVLKFLSIQPKTLTHSVVNNGCYDTFKSPSSLTIQIFKWIVSDFFFQNTIIFKENYFLLFIIQYYSRHIIN